MRVKSAVWSTLAVATLQIAAPVFAFEIVELEAQTHPPLPTAWGMPYVLDISGTLSTSCGLQDRPAIVEAYSGDAITINIAEPVTDGPCIGAAMPHPFRHLIDVGDLMESVEGLFNSIDVTVVFEDSQVVTNVLLGCATIDPCPPRPGRSINLDSGLWTTPDLASQSLVVNRQDDTLTVTTNSYDEAGNSDWMVAVGAIIDRGYYGDLWQSGGGECVTCPAGEASSEGGEFDQQVAGKVVVVVDGPGQAQVKINQGPFRAYSPYAYGYGRVTAADDPGVSLPDLSGRWAVSGGYWQFVNPPGIPVNIAPVFDLAYSGDGVYSVSNPTNADNELGQLTCTADGLCDFEPFSGGFIVVEARSPDTMEIRLEASLASPAMDNVTEAVRVR